MSAVNLRLAGGLGNQLFEFSFAIYIAYRNNIQDIVIDDRYLQSYDAQHNNYITTILNFNNFPFRISFQRNLLNYFRIARLIPNSSFFPFISDITEERFWYKQKSNFYLDGYFIWAIEGERLRDSVTLIKDYLELPEISVDNDQCVIHIRGSDFNMLGWNPPNINEFYSAAVDHFKGIGISKFLIITDDIAFAETICKRCCLANYSIEQNDMIVDFEIIRSARHKIISGSSFAIWASMLGSDDSNSNVVISCGNSDPLSSVLINSNIVSIEY